MVHSEIVLWNVEVFFFFWIHLKIAINIQHCSYCTAHFVDICSLFNSIMPTEQSTEHKKHGNRCVLIKSIHIFLALFLFPFLILNPGNRELLIIRLSNMLCIRSTMTHIEAGKMRKLFTFYDSGSKFSIIIY